MASKDEIDGLSPMELALHVLDGQDKGAAGEALLKRAVENADAMDDSALLASDTIGLLLCEIALLKLPAYGSPYCRCHRGNGCSSKAKRQLVAELAVGVVVALIPDSPKMHPELCNRLQLLKWIARSEDKSLFDSVAEKLTNADTSLVGPSIQYLLQYLSESEKEKLGVLAPIVAKRGKWLEDQIQELNTKFTWEMPNACVSGSNEATKTKAMDETAVNDKLDAFLRGRDISMMTKGVKSFNDFQEAQNFASKYPREKQNNCSFEMEASKPDGEVLVTITKTREWFLTQRKKLVQYQTELRILKEKFGDDFEATGDKKRNRLSE